jgi:hypothetical protein
MEPIISTFGFSFQINHLRKIGGQNLTNVTNKLLRAIVGNDLVSLYSRTGKGGKKSFEEMSNVKSLVVGKCY